MSSGLIPVPKGTLTPAQYGEPADVPPELEWLANFKSEKTRRAYKRDVSEFWSFTGLSERAQLHTVTRAHVIAWRKLMEHPSRKMAPATIRRKLLALSSLFDYLSSAMLSMAIRWMASNDL
jgi:site-specific recombinase XerD